MRSLPLLVLLLFAVVVQTSSAQSPPATPTLMEELLADGGHRRFKSFNDLYMTDQDDDGLVYTKPRQDWGRFQKFTIEQINDHEVTIKSNRGNFVEHGTRDFSQQAQVASEWVALTPVKNPNGSWSFKSRANQWLSGHRKYAPDRYYVNFQPDNMNCEHWFLEPYTPPATPTLMEELLADEGRRRFKSYNGRYLTDTGTVGNIFIYSPQLYVLPRNTEQHQDCIIEQINENEVAIKTNFGYISHRNADDAETRAYPYDWEMLTPVKNGDGTWSFHSRYNKWLSAQDYDAYEQEYSVDFKPGNYERAHWLLEPY